MSERVTPDELRDTAAMFSAHVEDRRLCRRCLLRWPCDAVVARDALTAAADRIEALEDDNAALRAWRAAYSALAIDRLDALMDTTRTVIADGRQEQTP